MANIQHIQCKKSTENVVVTGSYRCKFWQQRSIPWPHFKENNISAICRCFLLILCIGYAECPPYFYFRSSWPSLKFIRPFVAILAIVSILASDTLRDVVTLILDLLALVNGHAWRVTWPTPPSSLKILRVFVLELWVLMSPIGYYWHCFRRKCACAGRLVGWLFGWLKFNVPFQRKYGYIRDERMRCIT